MEQKRSTLAKIMAAHPEHRQFIQDALRDLVLAKIKLNVEQAFFESSIPQLELLIADANPIPVTSPPPIPVGGKVVALHTPPTPVAKNNTRPQSKSPYTRHMKTDVAKTSKEEALLK